MLKYAIRIRYSEEDGRYIASAPELPGCLADGSTPERAAKNLQAVAENWIEAAREDGRPVPEPDLYKSDYAGKVLVRMPAWLHRALDEAATDAGVSLNQHVVAALAAFTGMRQGKRPEAEALKAAGSIAVATVKVGREALRKKKIGPPAMSGRRRAVR